MKQEHGQVQLLFPQNVHLTLHPDPFRVDIYDDGTLLNVCCISHWTSHKRKALCGMAIALSLKLGEVSCESIKELLNQVTDHPWLTRLAAAVVGNLPF